MASSAFDAIVEDFEFLDNWEDRYRYVIDLGKAMDALDPALRTDSNRVLGCASQVWIRSEIRDGRLYFQGASDAMIVSGLIAVLHALWDGESVADVRASDPSAELARLDLTDHLSSQRSNGLASMIMRLKQDAA